LVFNGQAAKLIVDTAGGSIVDFHLNDQPLNPLHWATPAPGDTSPRGFGHFLCLDRWGAPSEPEGANGMPYHGEAAHVEWHIERAPALEGQIIRADMSAKLPLAGLSIKRTVRMSRAAAFFNPSHQLKSTGPYYQRSPAPDNWTAIGDHVRGFQPAGGLLRAVPCQIRRNHRFTGPGLSIMTAMR
jgi:hypothetical protein